MALGVVVGFPLFTALALQYMNAAHSIVFVSLLPLATAIFAVVRGGKNQIYFLDICNFRQSDCFTYMFSYRVKLLLASAIYTCLYNYSMWIWLCRRRSTFEKIGGWQVICWALILALPIMLLATLLYARFLSRCIYISGSRVGLRIFI